MSDAVVAEALRKPMAKHALTMAKMKDLWLDPIPGVLRDLAIEWFNEDKAKVASFLGLASKEDLFDLVLRNARALRDRGVFEAALLYA